MKTAATQFKARKVQVKTEIAMVTIDEANNADNWYLNSRAAYS